MSSFYRRGKSLWIAFKDERGKRGCRPSGYKVGQEEAVRALLAELDRKAAEIPAVRAEVPAVPAAAPAGPPGGAAVRAEVPAMLAAALAMPAAAPAGPSGGAERPTL